MVHAALAPGIGRDFDPFLFASIGDDRHGQTLSVISALARSDLDPWQEAVKLSGMPLAAANARLSCLIAALPGEPGPNRPLEAVVSDLIALLPRRRRPVPPLPANGATIAARPDARLGIGICGVVLLTAIGLIIATQTPPGSGRPAGYGTVAPHASTPNAVAKPSPAPTTASGPT